MGLQIQRLYCEGSTGFQSRLFIRSVELPPKVVLQLKRHVIYSCHVMDHPQNQLFDEFDV